MPSDWTKCEKSPLPGHSSGNYLPKDFQRPVIDSGSADHHCSDGWAEAFAEAAFGYGRGSIDEEKKTPPGDNGASQDPQPAMYDWTPPVPPRVAESRRDISSGTTTLVITTSDLPSLLGLESLRESRAMVVFGTQRKHCAGSDEDDQHPELWLNPSGLQCDPKPPDHLVLPYRDYKNVMSAFAAEQKAVSESKHAPGEHPAGGALSRAEAVPSVSPANAKDVQC